MVILPEHTVQEVEALLHALLGHQQQSYDDSMMCEWSEAIDTIIDNLKPEKLRNAKKRSVCKFSMSIRSHILLALILILQREKKL